MGDSLRGKVAVVTGSGQNIGRAAALLMAQEGAKVVTNSRRPGNSDGTAESTATEIKAAGGQAAPIYADVSTWAGAKALIDGALAAFGAIDILVNNAGRGGGGLLHELTEAQWDEVIGVSLTSNFLCSRHAVPVMMAKGYGRIIHMSSRAATVRGSADAPYSAAKAGLFGLTYSMARELAPHGITVNCIMPTAISPKMERTPRRYVGLPAGYKAEHVAPLVAYLASEGAAKVTGQLFHAGGGRFSLYTAVDVAKQVFQHGSWTVEELAQVFPTAFGAELGLPPPLFAAATPPR